MNLALIKIGFQLKLITKEEILDFAEEEFNNKLNDMFIDILSLSKQSEMGKFIDVLNQFSYEISVNEFRKAHTLFLFFLSKEKNWFELEKKILEYYGFFNLYLDEMDYEFWSRLQDDFSLRTQGFTTNMKMPSELSDYLKKQIDMPYDGIFFENLLQILKP